MREEGFIKGRRVRFFSLLVRARRSFFAVLYLVYCSLSTTLISFAWHIVSSYMPGTSRSSLFFCSDIFYSICARFCSLLHFFLSLSLSITWVYSSGFSKYRNSCCSAHSTASSKVPNETVKLLIPLRLICTSNKYEYKNFLSLIVAMLPLKPQFCHNNKGSSNWQCFLYFWKYFLIDPVFGNIFGEVLSMGIRDLYGATGSLLQTNSTFNLSFVLVSTYSTSLLTSSCLLVCIIYVKVLVSSAIPVGAFEDA